MIKLLIDECLTPDLVDVARARWIEADHVSRIGRGRAPDWALVQLAIESNYAIVTNNARDFRRLYRRIEVHPGLLIIIPQGYYGLQISLFRKVLDHIEAHPDIVNQLIEIDERGAHHLVPVVERRAIRINHAHSHHRRRRHDRREAHQTAGRGWRARRQAHRPAHAR